MSKFQRRKSKVYVKVNQNGDIIAVNSDIFINKNDLPNWIQIDEGTGDKYSLAQSHYFDKPIQNDDGTYNFKYQK